MKNLKESKHKGFLSEKKCKYMFISFQEYSAMMFLYILINGNIMLPTCMSLFVTMQ